ncbi:hypothetical protein pipiens_007622 [Culex pipiens pipiens]|uniref:Uncharacterized protein n=1 Tax=Culex pipiens pipiens TaxID=38569 RepID=A0ABD1DKF1_CULPP
MLLSGLALNAAVGATLLQPIKWQFVEEEVDIELVETMHSFVCIPKTPKRIETVKSELGLEMVKPNVSFLQRFTVLMDVGLLRDMIGR